MRRTIALTIASFTVLVFGLGLIASSYAQVTGRIFRVHVISSFGTSFGDCFRFDVPSPGLLTIDGLGQTITYRLGQLNQVPTSFKAVSRFGQPLSIMFSGDEIIALQQLNGEALSEFGNTFVFSGLQTATCVPGVVTSAATGNPYTH